MHLTLDARMGNLNAGQVRHNNTRLVSPTAKWHLRRLSYVCLYLVPSIFV
jgi:hypothetical protein